MLGCIEVSIMSVFFFFFSVMEFEYCISNNYKIFWGGQRAKPAKGTCASLANSDLNLTRDPHEGGELTSTSTGTRACICAYTHMYKET